jgi:hypothetical protein
VQRITPRGHDICRSRRAEEVIAALGYQTTGSQGATEAVEIPCADGDAATRYQRTQQAPHDRQGHRGRPAAKRGKTNLE